MNRKTLNVGQLKKILEQHPDDMEILYCLHSDYAFMEADEISTVKAVMKCGGWAMRSHPTMSAQNKAEEKTYLLFPGN